MKKILLDLDGVVADFYSGFARYLNECHGCHLPLDIEPDSYSFDYWGHGIDDIDIDKAIVDWINSGGFFNVPVYNGASEFTHALCDICQVYVVTARVGDWDKKLPRKSVNRIKSDTHKWLTENNIAYDKLFFSHDKINFCNEHDILTIIEDKPSTVLSAAEEGKNCILVERTYNKNMIDNDQDIKTLVENHPNIHRVDNYGSIIGLIK